MDSCEELLADARKDLEAAEQVLIRTYPVVEDPRLILAVAGDMYAAIGSAMRAILCHRGVSADLDFAGSLEEFRKASDDLGFEDDDLELISTLHRIMQEHKDSPVEFSRKGRFVICDGTYNCDVLSVDDMKKYLFRARLFVDKALNAISGEQGVEDE